MHSQKTCHDLPNRDTVDAYDPRYDQPYPQNMSSKPKIVTFSRNRVTIGHPSKHAHIIAKSWHAIQIVSRFGTFSQYHKEVSLRFKMDGGSPNNWISPTIWGWLVDTPSLRSSRIHATFISGMMLQCVDALSHPFSTYSYTRFFYNGLISCNCDRDPQLINHIV